METILLAKSAGFCYGVRRAVELAEQAARNCENCSPAAKRLSFAPMERAAPCLSVWGAAERGQLIRPVPGCGKSSRSYMMRSREGGSP